MSTHLAEDTFPHAATDDALQPLLAEIAARTGPWLPGYVQGNFPRMCASHIQDAVQEVYLSALEHPERFARAWEEGGWSRVEGLCKVIAWRSARGRWKRHSTHRELGGDALRAHPGATLPPQPVVAAYHLHLEATLEAALHRAAPACVAQTRAAVLDRFHSGDSDTAVARRHGIRREYLNRVKREVQRALLEEAA